MPRVIYHLKDRQGRPVGPLFTRYVDAFNHRAAINRPDVTIHEA